MHRNEKLGHGHAEIVFPTEEFFKGLLKALEEFDRHTKHVNELLGSGFE